MAARWRSCAAFVTIILVIAALVVFIALSTKMYTCDLMQDQPQTNLSTVRNIHSFDFTSLANFAGYLRYELQSTVDSSAVADPNRILTLSYLPLSVEFISLFEIKQGSYLFTINTDCAEIEFDMETLGKKTRVVDVTISLTKNNLGAETCHIDAPPIEMFEDGYYSCSTKRAYKCDPKRLRLADEHPGLIVSLVIEKLEFEIAGDPNKIKVDQFSKKINPCKA